MRYVPGLNPAQGENYIWSPLYGRFNAPTINIRYIMAGAEPLIEEGSPPHRKVQM